MGLFSRRSSKSEAQVNKPPIKASSPKVPKELQPFQFPNNLETAFITYKSTNDPNNQTLVFNVLYRFENFEHNYEKHLQKFMNKFKTDTLKKCKPQLYKIYGATSENYDFVPADKEFLKDISPFFKISAKILDDEEVHGLIKMQVQVPTPVDTIDRAQRKDYIVTLTKEGIKEGLLFFEEPKVDLKLFYVQFDHQQSPESVYDEVSRSIESCGKILIARNSLNNYGITEEHSSSGLFHQHQEISKIDPNSPPTLLLLVNPTNGFLPVNTVNLLTAANTDFQTAPYSDTTQADRFFLKFQ